MRIRKGMKKDKLACVRLAREDGDSSWKPSDFERSAAVKDAIFLVAEESGKLTGFILGFVVPTKRTEAMIHETRVSKSERGKGAGTKLVGAFCAEAFRRGVKAIYAEIEPKHLKFYKGSCRFRESHRWVEVSRKR